MAGANQIGAQLLEVVNLAVENHPHSPVFVRDRLVSSIKIYDAEPTHAETTAAIQMVALVIRTTMPDLIAHRAYIGQFGVPLAQKLSGNAAHDYGDPIIAVRERRIWL